MPCGISTDQSLMKTIDLDVQRECMQQGIFHASTVVGQLTQLECCGRWRRALQERQAEEEGNVKEQPRCVGSGLGKSLWVRVGGEVAKHDAVVGCVTDHQTG